MARSKHVHSAREIRTLGAMCRGLETDLRFWLLRHSERKLEAMATPDILNTMPVLDPTSLIGAHLGLRHEQKDTDPAGINVVFIDFGI